MAKTLSVVVRIKYSPNKARRMLNQDKTTMARNLRLDLTKVKLPHPPEANILSLIDEEEIAFFWETRKFSPLWTTVNNIVRLQANHTHTAMKEVKIERMWMEESAESNPFTRKPPPVSPTSPSRRIRSRSAIRRPSRDQNQTSFRQSSGYDNNRQANQERRRSRSSSPLPLVRTYSSRRNRTPERRNLDRTNLNTSDDTASEHMLQTLRRIENVQMALLNIEKSQQQTLIDQTQTERERRASYPPSAHTTEITTHNDIGIGLTEYPLPLRPIHPRLPAIPSRVLAAEDFYPLSPSTTTAPEIYPGYSEYENNPANTKKTYHHLPDVIDTSWVWQSPEPSTTPRPLPANLPSAIEKDNHDSFTSDSKPPLPSTSPEPNALLTASTSSADTANVERISDLTREFWDTRRQLSAASARCSVLEKHLRASEIDLRKEIVELENHLLEERRERIHAETVLDDVLRECKEPVIIPALFATLMRDHGMGMVNS